MSTEKKTKITEDCISNKHINCLGCSCICHWDEVLIRHFSRLGRIQNVESIVKNMRPESELNMGKTLATMLENYEFLKKL